MLHARWLRSLLLVLLTIPLVGGSPARANESCPEFTASPPRLTVAQRPDHPLVADATIGLDHPAPVYLEYGNPSIGWLRTPSTEPAARHHLPIVRLRPETAYQVRAALGVDGCLASTASAEFVSGALPAELRRLTTQVQGSASFNLVLMDVRLADAPSADLDRRWLVAFEPDGEPVWYYPLPKEVLNTAPARGANAVIRRPNGNFAYLSKSFGIEEITPDGRVVRRLRLRGAGIHHDILELPDDRILFLGSERRRVDFGVIGGPSDLPVIGDTINIVDLETGQFQRVWSAFETLVPTRRPLHRQTWNNRVDEWTHANSLNLGPRGNILVSFRHLDQVISLSPDLASIEWRLGGVDSDFDFPDPSDRFYAQHTAYELPGGRVLLFDNGNHRPDGEYSRGLELELDFSTMTTRKVWEYRHQPDEYAGSQSSVQRLPNGHTLVAFGTAVGPEDPLLLVQADPAGANAWQMTLALAGQRTSRYRAYALDSLNGEVRLASPAE